MRAIVEIPLPVLRIRGTHKSTSIYNEQAMDFDLSLDRPADMVLQDLRMGNTSYHPHDLHKIQEQVRALCNGLDKSPHPAKRNMYVKSAVSWAMKLDWFQSLTSF